MSTGTLRRHREALQKIREEEADLAIAEAVTVVSEPATEPAQVALDALDEPAAPVASKPTRAKKQTEE